MTKDKMYPQPSGTISWETKAYYQIGYWGSYDFTTRTFVPDLNYEPQFEEPEDVKPKGSSSYGWHARTGKFIVGEGDLRIISFEVERLSIDIKEAPDLTKKKETFDTNLLVGALSYNYPYPSIDGLLHRYTLECFLVHEKGIKESSMRNLVRKFKRLGHLQKTGSSWLIVNP